VISSQGFSRKGEFYYNAGRIHFEVYFAAFDPVARATDGHLVQLEGRYTGLKKQAVWSPSGDRIAYVQAIPNIQGGPGPFRDAKLAIQTMVTGDVQLLTLPLRGILDPSWLPDGSGVVISATDMQGRQGLFQVSLSTGTLAVIVDSADGPQDPQRHQPVTSPDGRQVFFLRSSPNEQVIAARELTSGVEQTIVSRPQPIGPFSLSPDGRWLAIASRRDSRVYVVPSSGGQPRPLAAIGEHPTILSVDWSPDSQGVFVSTTEGRGSELWQIPLNGAEARNTGIAFWSGTISQISLHPGGHRFALSTTGLSSETWVLQNIPPQR
jgi:dipeptidyl aminopeptidase/acylaminoacyl peptidase